MSPAQFPLSCRSTSPSGDSCGRGRGHHGLHRTLPRPRPWEGGITRPAAWHEKWLDDKPNSSKEAR